MTPVKQTDFNKGTGNCWAACIASILDLPLEEVPNFCHQDLGPHWLKRTIEWLVKRGYGVLHMQNAAEALTAYPHLFANCFCIVSGKSPRAKSDEDDFMHAIVGKTSCKENAEGYYTHIDFYHDPHPSDAMIVGDPAEITVIIKR